MIDITASTGLIRWVVDHFREAPGALAGGFVAYFLHEIYHRVWRRPGHFLIRRILRRTPK